jgi:hypothetical protein
MLNHRNTLVQLLHYLSLSFCQLKSLLPPAAQLLPSQSRQWTWPGTIYDFRTALTEFLDPAVSLWISFALSPFSPQKRTTERCFLVLHSWSINYWNQPLNMIMCVCYIDCDEAGLCCTLLIHLENLLHPLQLFYFLLRPIYRVPLVVYSFGVLASMYKTTVSNQTTTVWTIMTVKNWNDFNFIKSGLILQIKHIVINFKHIFNVWHKIKKFIWLGSV